MLIWSHLTNLKGKTQNDQTASKAQEYLSTTKIFSPQKEKTHNTWNPVKKIMNIKKQENTTQIRTKINQSKRIQTKILELANKDIKGGTNFVTLSPDFGNLKLNQAKMRIHSLSGSLSGSFQIGKNTGTLTAGQV